MNILNLASIIGDVPLSVLTLHTRALEKLNSLLPEEHHFQPEHDGEAIVTWFKYLPPEYQKIVEQTTILSTIETSIAIADITNHRQSEAYKHRQQDQVSNTMAAMFMISMLVIAGGFVLFFVFKVVGGGDKVTGIIYNFLVGLFHTLGWILPKL